MGHSGSFAYTVRLAKFDCNVSGRTTMNNRTAATYSVIGSCSKGVSSDRECISACRKDYPGGCSANLYDIAAMKKVGQRGFKIIQRVLSKEGSVPL